jgi:hypothetical protein
MTIPESQAKRFHYEFFHSGDHNTLENLKDRLETKLFSFKRERDQLDFLKVLIHETKTDIQNHQQTCATANCGYDEIRNLGIFLMEQEIEVINTSYTFVPKSEDAFSVNEETDLHNKLNQIIEHLKKQDLGQEILFDEIESLKNHFNLGKKTWFQLVKGKLMEVTGEKIIEATVATEILKVLSDGYNEFIKWVN